MTAFYNWVYVGIYSAWLEFHSYSLD